MELPIHPEVFVSRITRKELKTDKFALEVEHGISFFEHHKNEAIKYGAIGIVAIVLIFGYTYYSLPVPRGARQDSLAAAIRVQEAGGAQPGNAGRASPSQKAKDQEATRVLGDL